MASDVNISLGLDDSVFTQKLKAAQASVTGFGTNANKSFAGMQSGLNTASKGMEELNGKFELLGKAIVGVGIVEFVSSLMESARNLKDLASSVDVSTGRMMEMGTAATYAGGSLNQVSSMLSKMEVAVGQAAAGNEGLRTTFANLGVSLDAMTRLTPDETFNKIATALAGITNPSERAAKATEVFGKTWKGLNFNDYVKNVTELYGSMTKYEESQKAANEVAESMALQMDLIKVATTNVLKPLLELATGTGSLEDKMSRAETIAKVLAVGLGAIAVGGVITGLKSLAGVVSSVAGAMGLTTAATTAESVALTGNTAALLANNALRNAGNIARVQSLTAQLAEDTARAVGLAGMVGEGAALATLEKTRWRLTAATAASAQSAAIAAFAETSAGVAAGGAIAPTTGFAVAAAGLARSLALVAAESAVLIVAAAGVQEIYTQLTGGKSGENFLYKWLTEDKKGTTELKTATEDSTKTMTTSADAIKQVVNALEEKTRVTKQATENLIADNLVQKEKANLLSQTLQLGKTEVDARIAGLEAINKYKKEEQRIDKEIADLRMQGANDPNAVVGPAIKALEAQKTEMKIIAQLTTDETRLEGERQDKMAMAVTYVEMEKKAKESMRSIENELADLNATETEKKLRNVDRQIEKEIELAIAKRQAQLGTNTPIAKSESDEIAAKIRNEYAAQKELTAELIKQNQVRELGLFAKKSEIDIANQLNKIMDETATMTMTDIEKKYYAIGAAARDSAKSAIEAEEARRGSKLDPQEAQAYYDAAAKGTEKLKNAQKESYDMSRTFETGWKKAMNTYVESATDASKTAAELFTKATKGMEDAIVGFAKTGKFEWKSFAADMLETLLRSQIQQTFANMMNGMKDSTGGLMGAIGSLFGGGSSGSATSQKQDTGIMGAVSSIFGGGSGAKDGTPVFVTNWPGSGVGGAFSAASSLLGSGAGGAGSGSPLSSVITGIGDLFASDNQSTAQYSSGYASRQGFGGSSQQQDSGLTSVLSSLGDGISSFTSGISDFFGGFFAGGGSLPAGKFGIVGEKGPELITGPANITPGSGVSAQGGGVTNVYYTINANDASSFAQMLARDPSLIYALTLQGSKGMKA